MLRLECLICYSPFPRVSFECKIVFIYFTSLVSSVVLLNAEMEIINTGLDPEKYISLCYLCVK